MILYTLRQLEYAVRTADLGSVAAAAEAMGVAQPSVSAALMKLEDQIRHQLFVRQPAHGVMPSPQGSRFLAEARSLLAHADEVQRLAAATGTEIAGQMTLGGFPTLAAAYGPRLLKSFTALHGAAKVVLKEGSQTELIEGLRTGQFDLALLYPVDLPSDLEPIPLARFDPYVLLPASHRLAKKRRVSLNELASEPMILLDILPSRVFFTRILERAGVTPSIVFASPSLELVRGLVGQGMGYSLLVTRPHGDTAYDGGALAARPIAEETEKGEIALASLRSLRPTRLVTAFEEHAKMIFRKLAKP
jgi:DNA-binding transcriptional LysR family regulator